MIFHDFNLTPNLQDGLDSMGFETPTPIQEQAIPVIMKGHDLIACAQTGTGKTAAYLLPVIHHLTENKKHTKAFRCLIIVPTRELALQIDQQVAGFAYFCPVSSVPVYGGGAGDLWDVQRNAFAEGVEIVIATPGRMIAHLNMGYVDTSSLDCLILDEADRMLDMGFYDDLMRIVKELPKERQTLMFSATMPDRIRQMAKKMLHNPVQISLEVSKPAEGVLQSAYYVEDANKNQLLKEIFTSQKPERVIVFSSRKETVKVLTRELRRIGLNVGSIHSDLEQAEREQAMLDFKNQKIQILIGTDIISRGIDIEDVSIVLNYDVPGDSEEYIHRIGRTARAAKTGEAITFISHKDKHKFHRIEKFLGNEVRKVPTPDHLQSAPVERPEHQQRPNRRKPRFRGKPQAKKQ